MSIEVIVAMDLATRTKVLAAMVDRNNTSNFASPVMLFNILRHLKIV